MMIIISVIVVAAVAGGAVAGYILLKDDGGDGNDYSLLDATEVKKGFEYEVEWDSKTYHASDEYEVLSVADDGKLTVRTIYEEDYETTDEFDLDTFRSAFIDIDGTAPEGVTVNKTEGEDGSFTYVINGRYYAKEQGTENVREVEMEFDNVRIVLSATGKVTSVSGEASYETNEWSIAEPDNFRMENSVECNLFDKDGAPMATQDVDTESREVVEYESYESLKDYFQTETMAIYSGCKVESEDSRYGGLDCTKYIVNGTDTFGDVYENFEIYTYKGFILHEEGTYNGERWTTTVTIHK